MYFLTVNFALVLILLFFTTLPFGYSTFSQPFAYPIYCKFSHYKGIESLPQTLIF